ncbi:MAG: hypothetical protein ACYCVB_13300 [Bacilli bacterium]
MKKIRALLLGGAFMALLPMVPAFAAVAQSNTVTITGGYEKTAQTQQWEQTGTTQQAYTYQANVTTYQNEQVQTGTMTRTVQTGAEQVQTGTITQKVQTGTKQVQTGTEQQCDGEWVYNVSRRHWMCSGSLVTKPVYTTEPVYVTETIPVYSTVPVYTTQTIPVYTTESVPVTQWETLTGYRSVPAYGWVTLNTQQWVPVSIQ